MLCELIGSPFVCDDLVEAGGEGGGRELTTKNPTERCEQETVHPRRKRTNLSFVCAFIFVFGSHSVQTVPFYKFS